MDYGRDVGTISMVVFRERPANVAMPQPRADLDPALHDEDFAILTRGVFPTEPATDLAGLRQKLAGSLAASPLRGLIAEGGEIEHKTVNEGSPSTPTRSRSCQAW